MTIVSREEWGAVAPNPGCAQNRDLHTVTLAVVHYSDTGPDVVIGPEDQPGEHPATQTVRAIQQFHMKTRGWCDIAYHWLIADDGTVFAGRPVGQVGAHALGHNSESVGYCLLTDGPVSDAQKLALIERIHADRAPLGIAYARIAPHRDVTATACPGDEIASWVNAGLPAPDAPLPGTAPQPGPCSDLAPGPPPEGLTLLVEGMRGAEVVALQARLADHGYPPENSKTKKKAWDGIFGPGTAAAVAALQHDNNIEADGKVGRQTWCVLGIR